MAALDNGTGIAGFDCRIDEDGNSHAWRMIAWRPTDEGDVVVRCVGSLPDNLQWLSIPRDPLYGDLQMLSTPPLCHQKDAIVSDLVTAGISRLLVTDAGCAPVLLEHLRSCGIQVREVPGYYDITAGPDHIHRTGEFPGQAGHEIEYIRKTAGTGS